MKLEPKSLFARNNLGSYDISDTKNELSKRAAAIQIIIALLQSLSVMSSGMGLGYPSITTKLLSANDDGVALSVDQVSWFAAITAILCPVGGQFSGFLTDKIGRRNTLILVNILAVLSWVIIGFSSRVDVEILFIELMISRVIMGLVVGMSTTPAVMYVSEICHPKLRGRLTLMSSPFFTAFGLLVVYFLGFLVPSDFRLVALIAAGISLVIVLISFFLPESPVFLVTSNKPDKARKVLSILRHLEKNDPKIDLEIQQIQLNRQTSDKKQSIFSSWKEFKTPELYKPFLIMVIFFTIQQFSGIFLIFIYASQFSLEAGVVIDDFLSAVIIGLIRCCTTILIAFASDRYGRKPLALSSGVGMFVCMLGLSVCSKLSLNDTTLNWLPAAFLYLFVFSGSLGILTLPFAMVGEIYPQKVRGFAVGLTLSIAFIVSFFVIKTFTTVFQLFGSFYIFLFYAVVALIEIVFAVFILPETKGKSLEEIEKLFKKQ